MAEYDKMNDTFGHDYGDKVLAFLGKVLTEHKRKEDTVGRFGGEEFTLLFPETQSTGALNYMNKVQSEFRKYNGEKGFSISAGISEFPKDGGSFDEIYKNADEKLYRAKETKNCIML